MPKLRTQPTLRRARDVLLTQAITCFFAGLLFSTGPRLSEAEARAALSLPGWFWVVTRPSYWINERVWSQAFHDGLAALFLALSILLAVAFMSGRWSDRAFRLVRIPIVSLIVGVVAWAGFITSWLNAMAQFSRPTWLIAAFGVVGFCWVLLLLRQLLRTSLSSAEG